MASNLTASVCCRVETAPGKLDPSNIIFPTDTVAPRALSSPSPVAKPSVASALDLRRMSTDAGSQGSPSSTSGLNYEATNGSAPQVPSQVESPGSQILVDSILECLPGRMRDVSC